MQTSSGGISIELPKQFQMQITREVPRLGNTFEVINPFEDTRTPQTPGITLITGQPQITRQDPRIGQPDITRDIIIPRVIQPEMTWTRTTTTEVPTFKMPPFVPQTPIQIVPQTLFLPAFGGGSLGRGGFFGGGGPRTKYAPSLAAEIFNIQGTPQKGLLGGFELRPIPSHKKARRGRKK
jgi:hypothetical protein